MRARSAIAALFGAGLMLSACVAAPPHPEARVYQEDIDVAGQIEGALMRAAAFDTRVIVVMGANWCHDSRSLAGWFETPRFAAMLAEMYEVVYVDAGQPRANLTNNRDVAQRFGIEQLNGTPNVLVVSPGGELLNPATATTWNDAASRSEDEIFAYFAEFAPEI